MDGNAFKISYQSVLSGESLPFSNLFFKQLFDALCDGVFFVDRERKILYWNHGAEMLTGYSREEVVGRYCNAGLFDHTNGAGCNLCEGNCPLVKAIETKQPQNERAYFRHKDRRRIAIFINTIPLKNNRNEIVGAVGVIRDASTTAALEDAYKLLREMSEKDALTGVANRQQLDKTIEDHLTLLKNNGIPFSLILLDIDNFKRIKKIHGNTMSDKILVHFAQLLRRQCGGIDIIGRCREGEYLILLRQQNLDLAIQMAERLRIAVSTSIPEGFSQPSFSGSFGVAEATLDDTAGGLVKRVSLALHQAKTAGGNRVESLEPAITI